MFDRMYRNLDTGEESRDRRDFYFWMRHHQRVSVFINGKHAITYTGV